MDESIISFNKVSKRFGTVTAVDQASFDIYRGEFFFFVGSFGLRQDHTTQNSCRF